MSKSSKQQYHDLERQGVFNYLDDGAESSLHRNGKVLAKRDADGSDAGAIGVAQQAYSVNVFDARQFTGANRKTCERNGFELLDAAIGDQSIDFFDHADVVQKYYRECAELVAASTGGRAFAFDHNIRSAVGKNSNHRITGGQTVQGPAKMVHGDYTLVSAPQRLKDLAQPPKLNDTYASVLGEGESLISQAMVDKSLAAGGRFAIINVWRSIAKEPVQINPLAMCDGQTVDPKDLVTFEIHYADRIGENYFAKYDESHQWAFFPAMTRDEALLIKQWDSAGRMARTRGDQSDPEDGSEPCTFSFHSAFEDPTTPDDAPDRWSIEVRCAVVW